MSTTTTTNKSSPKFCLLLKTLLFLLCIYIKRVTAASLGANINDNMLLDTKYVIEGEQAYELDCPLGDAIEIKDSTKNKPYHQSYLKQLKKDTIDKVEIIWLKDNSTLHRENGNLIVDQLNTDEKSLIFLAVGPSDAGQYTCLLNYTNVSEEAFRYLNLYPSVSFELVVEPKASILPDHKPTISHPPANLFVDRGKNVTFTCNRIDTLSHQTTYWFKSCCSSKNQTCIDKFLKAYNKTGHEKVRSYLDRYMIGHYDDELNLNNVSDKDIGYYGCLVENNIGIDIRLGQLNLIDVYLESQVALTTTVTPIELTTVIITNKANTMTMYTISGSSSTISPVLSTPLQRNLSKSESFLGTTVAASHEQLSFSHLLTGFIAVFVIFATLLIIGLYCFLKLSIQKDKKLNQNNLIMPAPIVGNNCKEVDLRQHLPSGVCTDIYNIGKNADGFISGHHLHQGNGHLMSQSNCDRMLDEEKNPSISSNSNSDEASSWGKSMSSHGDNSKTFYQHTSNTTTTTVPMYDHPPSTGKTQLCGAIVQDACVINPTYGFIRPESDATNWAFPRRNLERLNKIGEGQFGEVWRYIARQKDGNESFVAVKQLKNRAGLGDRERLELIAEIEIMKSVNNHPNVIKILNYCADDYEPILLIMEYAENGKLQTYLRNCRSFRKSYGCISDSSTIITSKELIKFSYHIAKGMEYVASQGIVHRDLASRNILVSKDKICKVADFGFARRVSDDCAYERTTANPVPVKWMAPEALVENKFTSKSDVFSLGILIWEIVTLGATPYEYLTSSEVYKKVTSGGRLEKPPHCKNEFYNIMARCWLHDPTQRPTFEELAHQLEKLLLSENDYIELDQYPEHAYYNILNIEEKEIVHIVP